MPETPMTARQLAELIHQDLQQLIQVPEPFQGDVTRSLLARLLNDLGTHLYHYACRLDGRKNDVLADVLTGVGCCIAGIARGVPQDDCQHFATELMRTMRIDVPAGICRVAAGEDPEQVIADLSALDDNPEKN